MSRTQLLGSAVAVAAGLMLSSSAAHAATITWSAPTNIAGDSDVITTGTLVYAFNFSQFQLPVTVNTVPFAQFAVPNGGNAIVGNNATATIGFQDLESSNTSYGSTAAPFSGLSASYQALVGSGVGSSTGATLTLNLFSLNNGSTYVIQLWCNDSDLVHGGTPTIFAAGNVVTAPSNPSFVLGGLGTWVSGTFTATGTTQAITVGGVSPAAHPIINAFQLREVPAPGAAALLGLGGLVVACRRRG